MRVDDDRRLRGASILDELARRREDGERHETSRDAAKGHVFSGLVNTIPSTDLRAECEKLGWIGGSSGDAPKQKHYKVAIVDVLIRTAKANNWHVVSDGGYFYIYNGAYWIPMEDAEVKQLLKDAAIKMGYSRIECLDIEFIDKLFKQASLAGFFSRAHAEKQSIINLQNGSLELSSDDVKLKEFDHEDFLTHQLDFSHKPGAVNATFLNYLSHVLPNADTRATLQQVAGYLFVKGLKMERIFFLYGEGANGKSVFFEVLSGVIGEANISNYSLESLTDSKGYHRAMIKDKIVNYGTDIRLTKVDAAMFKTLASGEPIEARLPYRDPFMMVDYAKLIFNVNKMDSANIEYTHGFYRRLLIIPFQVTIPDDKQDRDLHKKILKDKAGVLNWIIDGAREGIKNRDIFVSDECLKIKARFIKETDSVAMFEEQHILEGLRGSIYYEMVSAAHTQYKQYCSDAGHKALGRTNFSRRMEAIGFTKSKKDDGAYLEKHYHGKKV